MRKEKAKAIAQSGRITWGELQQTLRRAYESGAANEERGIVNKGLSKAVAYNIMVGFAGEYDPDLVVNGKIYSAWIGAQHILREFGKFWEGWEPPQPERKPLPPPAHEPPVDCPF